MNLTLRPPRIHPSAEDSSQPTSPKPTKTMRPGWKPTLLRRSTFEKLRDLQKSTTDPSLDLSYLSDACVQLALELGADAIVRRALADLDPLARHK